MPDSRTTSSSARPHRSALADVRRLISSRAARGWSLASLGPNDARLLFDLAAGGRALAATLLFLQAFAPDTPGRWLLLALPVLFLAANTLGGLYTRFKRGSSRIKALVLAGSVALTCVLGRVIGAPAAGVALWGLLVVG